MGASCAKGSAVTDPDRAPYGSPKKSPQKVRQKGNPPTKVKGGSLRSADEPVIDQNGSDPTKSNEPQTGSLGRQRGKKSRNPEDFEGLDDGGIPRNSKGGTGPRKNDDDDEENNNNVRRTPSRENSFRDRSGGKRSSGAWDEGNQDVTSRGHSSVERPEGDDKSQQRPRQDHRTPAVAQGSSRPGSSIRDSKEFDSNSLRRQEPRTEPANKKDSEFSNNSLSRRQETWPDPNSKREQDTGNNSLSRRQETWPDPDSKRDSEYGNNSLRRGDQRNEPNTRRDFRESDIDNIDKEQTPPPVHRMNGDSSPSDGGRGRDPRDRKPPSATTQHQPDRSDPGRDRSDPVRDRSDPGRDRSDPGRDSDLKRTSSSRDSQPGNTKTSEYYSASENVDDEPVGDTSFSPRSDAAFSSLSSPATSPSWQQSDKHTSPEPVTTYVSAEKVEAVKEALIDLSEDNKKLASQHHLCPNTRTKLIQAVEKWFKTRDDQIVSRVMVITGKPGIGKTCFAAEMTRKFYDYSAGSHFFHFAAHHTEHNLASAAMKSLAYHMGTLFPRFYQNLAAQPKISRVMEGDDVNDIFDAMMKSLPRHRPRRMVLILDAIDECDISQREKLLKVINEFDQKAPNWLFLMVTLDDESQLSIQLDSVVHIIEVDEKSDAMHADLKRYFRNYMMPYFDVMSIDGAQTRTMQNSKGKFLAANLLRRKLECMPAGVKLTVRDAANFPSGLSAIYTEAFQTLYNYLSARLSAREANNLYMDYVGLLLLAREPIDKSAFSNLNSTINADDALFQLEGCVTINSENAVSFSHKSIITWLLQYSDVSARHLVPDLADVRQKIAEQVMIWLRLILEGTSKYLIERNLEIYAVKHCITHLVEATRQFKNIAKILCSFNFIDEKLHLTNYRILLNDYRHKHYQIQQDGGYDLVELDDYMKNFPNLSVQISEYRGFLTRAGKRLRPGFVVHQAANYCDAPNLHNAAKYKVGNLAWLEDQTAFGATSFSERLFPGGICDFDVSPDAKVMVVLSCTMSGQYSLHVVSPSNIDSAITTITSATVGDRFSGVAKILQDGNTAFIGSLDVFVNLKTGKTVPTELNVRSVPLNEPYSVECCDSTAKLFCCGVTTLPFGGDLLLMIVFDLDSKKCVATLEVAKVDNNEDCSQFGIRSCAVSPDGTMLCAFSKQSNSFELQGVLWSTFSWKIMRVVTVASDLLSKCSFLDNNYIIISSGIHNINFTEPEELPDASYIWTIHKREAVAVSPMDNRETSSIYHHKGGQVTHVQWFQFKRHAHVSRWKKWISGRAPDHQAMVYGLDGILDVHTTEKLLIFVGKNSVRVCRLSDLDKLDNPKGGDTFPLSDAIVRGVSFIPRPDEILVTYNSTNKAEENIISVASIKQKSTGGFQIMKKLIIEENIDLRGPLSGKHFNNQYSCYGICRLTKDSNFAVICTGTKICMIEISSGAKRSIQTPAAIPSSRGTDCLFSVLSPKEPIVAAVYTAFPDIIYIHELFKDTRRPLDLQLPSEAGQCRVLDLSFIPTSGQLVSYYTGDCNVVVVWNIRNGDIVSHKIINGSLFYAGISPAFDRMALCLSADGYESVLLRNSDSSFSNNLMLPVGPTSSPEIEMSDIEFTADGTVLLGMFAASRIFRVWNSFNGDTLIDLNMADFSQVEVVGMVTNTHVLFSDSGTLEVCDIGTGETLALLSFDQPLPRKLDFGGLRISQQGNFVVGVTKTGALKVVQVHNISAVKFKTTLQRMDKQNLQQ